MDYHLIRNYAMSGPLGGACSSWMNVDPPRLGGYSATYYSWFGSNRATCGGYNYTTQFAAYYRIWGSTSYEVDVDASLPTFFDG